MLAITTIRGVDARSAIRLKKGMIGFRLNISDRLPLCSSTSLNQIFLACINVADQLGVPDVNPPEVHGCIITHLDVVHHY